MFAAARAAGTAERELSDAATIDAALHELGNEFGDPLREVLARCTFLVNGIATTDRAHGLDPDDVLDVLPPFAGG
jgi:molybdopterin synthase sulfur carrier subunit